MAEKDYNTARLFLDGLRDVYGKVKSMFGKEIDSGVQETIRLLERAVGMRKVSNTGYSEPQYLIDENFTNNFNAWVKNGRKNGVRLLVGSTSEALKSIGVKNQEIYWDSSKVNNTLTKHSTYLTTEIIKQVPEIIENPIIVMQSKQSDSRLTMFGEVYDSDGLPIMAVIELLPTNLKNGFILDEIKVVSSHSRKKADNPTDIAQTQSIINTSDILYIDPNKKRTDNWLVANRLQLPLHITNYGSIKMITYPEGSVNSYSTQNSEKDANEKTEMQLALERAGIDSDTFTEEGPYSINNLTPEQARAIKESEGLTKTEEEWYNLYQGQVVAEALEGIKKYKVKIYNFPSYKTSQSDTHEIATRWAHREDIDVGTQNIAFHKGRCYLIEKFDDGEFGYQIVCGINYKEYHKKVERLEQDEHRRLGSKSGESDFRNSTNEYGKQSLGSTSTQHKEKSGRVSGMDKYQDGEWEISDNGNRDNQYDIENWEVNTVKEYEEKKTVENQQSLINQKYSITNLSPEQVEAVKEAETIQTEMESHIKTMGEEDPDTTPLARKLDKTVSNWVDRFQLLKRFDEYAEKKTGEKTETKDSAYTMAMNSLNAEGTVMYIIKNGLTDLEGNVNKGKGLFEILKPLESKEEMRHFEIYLTARHGIEWLSADKGGKVKVIFGKDNLDNIDSLKNAVENLERKYPQFKSIAEEIYGFQKAVLFNFGVEGGLLSKETANKFFEMYPEYVPFYRDIKKMGRADSIQKEFADLDAGIKEANGGSAKLISPIESIISNTAKFVTTAKKNAVMQAIYKQAENKIEGLDMFLEIVPETEYEDEIHERLLRNGGAS